MLFLERVVEKILERLKEKRSKPAAAGVGVPKSVTFQHHNEKILGQILRVFDGMTAPANKRKDWAPVKPAEFGQGRARAGILAFAVGGGKDETPARRGEVARFAAIFRPDRGIHGPR